MSEPGAFVYKQRSVHLRLRLLKDRIARYGVAAGGIGVIFSILLIFFYLFFIVAPLAEVPEMDETAVYALQSESPIIYLAMEEQAEIGTVFEQSGKVRFISTSDGVLIQQVQLPIPKGVKIASFSAAHPTSGVVALGLSNGQALVVRHRYKVSYPNDQRVITPQIDYPLGSALVAVAADGSALLKVVIQEDESFTLVGWSKGGMLSVVRASPQESLLGDEAAFEFERGSGWTDLENIQALLLDPVQHNLYVISHGGNLAWFNISDLSNVRLVEQLSITAPGVNVLESSLLSGGTSIMVAGDMPGWLQREMGIGFDQRNSLVVGMAMGFAVIPTIFSIAEDAIFSVPKYLTNGSLALGATPWQTLTKVVLLTASPGIFSGIMMGVGRAVGETMIVLMATGNTPVMDMSIFQGMRTLSANIAVEMPEAEVGSTHYRVLFLAALVLFVFTFVFNTGAELVRQRLREKYSKL